MANLASVLDESDFVTTPLAILAIGSTVTWGLDTVSLVGAGFLAWTFIEYWVHFALHSRRFPRLRSFHMKHHQRPHEATGGTLYSSLIILALVVVAMLWSASAAVLCGFLIGYLAFIVLHRAMHIDDIKWSFFERLADNHDAHHHGAKDKLFGVTTPLWDHLFGTA